MTTLQTVREALLHLFFPHTCSGCGNDSVPTHQSLCMRCLCDLPETGFAPHPENPVEKIFAGRLPVQAATSQYYFTKDSLMQRLMHALKYKGDQQLGFQLGLLMGEQLAASSRFETDALVPLPLFAAREKKRGYNQAAVLCRGMSVALQVPVLDKLVIRAAATATQTNKRRIERWTNMEGKFQVTDKTGAEGKRLLLVDDVITTGATLEACGQALLEIPGCTLYIASLCATVR